MIPRAWNAIRKSEKPRRFRHGQSVTVRGVGAATVVADDGHFVEVLIEESLENVLLPRGEVR